MKCYSPWYFGKKKKKSLCDKFKFICISKNMQKLHWLYIYTNISEIVNWTRNFVKTG